MCYPEASTICVSYGNTPKTRTHAIAEGTRESKREERDGRREIESKREREEEGGGGVVYPVRQDTGFDKTATGCK